MSAKRKANLLQLVPGDIVISNNGSTQMQIVTVGPKKIGWTFHPNQHNARVMHVAPSEFDARHWKLIGWDDPPEQGESE